MIISTTESNVAPVLRQMARVLVVVKPDDPEDLLSAAAALAARHGAKLDVLTCVEPPQDLAAIAHAAEISEDDALERMVGDRRQRIATQIAPVLHGKMPSVHLYIGKTFVQIIEHVVRHDVDIVVKTAEPLSGLQGFLFGSTDQHLMRKCPSAVWLRLPDTPVAPTTILAAVDVDSWDTTEPETLKSLNQRVIETSLRMAAESTAVVHVLHAWDAMGEGMVATFASGHDPRLAAQKYVDEILSMRRQSLNALVQPFQKPSSRQGPHITPRLVRGQPHRVIAEQAKQLGADLIVMGTVARTGLSGIIIGNTAENILNTVECSVVTVKPEGFVSPIVVE